MKANTRRFYFAASVGSILVAFIAAFALDTDLARVAAVLGAATVMLSDAISWHAVASGRVGGPKEIDGSRSRVLDRIDTWGVIAASTSLAILITATFWTPRLAELAIVGMAFYCAACAAYWHHAPREDHYLLGATMRAWAILDDWSRTSRLYFFWFIVAGATAVGVYVTWKIGWLAPTWTSWKVFAGILWLYVLVYWALGAPMRLVLRPRLLGGDIFLSYSSRDEIAGSAVLGIEQLSPGYQVFFAPRSIPGGAAYPEYLRDAIRNSRVFLLLLTSESVVSDWVQEETRIAIKSESESGRPHILPVAFDLGSAALDAFRAETGLSDSAQVINASSTTGASLAAELEPQLEKLRHGYRV